MRRTPLALLLVAAACPAFAALNPTDWRTARPISLSRMSEPGWVYLPLDAQALAVPSLFEYRVVGVGGKEIPYRMVVSSGQVETQTLPAALTSEARSERQAQIVIDLGESRSAANRVSLLLRGDNFRCQVKVEGSSDKQQWWTLNSNGLVYRHEGRFEQTSVSLPPSDHPYLRLTITRLQGALPVLEGAQVVNRVLIPQKLVEVPVKFSRREDKSGRTSRIDIDAERLTRDIVLARFDVAEPRFSRSVLVETSGDGKEYQFYAYRVLERTIPGRRVVLWGPIPAARYLRFTVQNGDDPPLTTRSVIVFRAERGLIFSADPAGRYELWYGRPSAPQPEYDLQWLPLPASLAKLPVATLGPARPLPRKPPPPTPWSEKHPALFWAALAVVVALLALLIYRGLRGVTAAGGNTKAT